MIIYKIENLITGKVYVGQTVRSLNQRIQSYKDEIRSFIKGNLKAQRPIIHSMNKYGIDNFRFFILDRASSQKELDTKEQLWISIYSSYVPGIGYNLDRSRGGIGRRSPESNKKMSEAMLGEQNSFYGKRHTSETLQTMSNTHKGKIISNETRKKIGLALSGSKNVNSKLNDEQVIQLKLERGLGATLKELSKKYQVAISRVSDIVNGKTYKIIVSETDS